MTGTALAGRTVLVTGASRGFGRGIAAAFVAGGADVVGVARSAAGLAEVRAELGEAFAAEPGDVTDPGLAVRLLAGRRPDVLVLNAGATPPMGPLTELTWHDFDQVWRVDVRQAFEWSRAALRLPLAPGSVVVLVSSGAALNGSPLSGGYAGAKATVRFVARYGAREAALAGLDLRFVTVLPQLTPATALGAVGVASYAADAGVDVDTFVARLSPVLRPEVLGGAVVDLVVGALAGREPGGAGEASVPAEYLVTGRGAAPLGDAPGRRDVPGLRP